MKAGIRSRLFVGWACVLMVTLVPGCWGQKEVGDMSIMLGLGIDRLSSGETRVTVQVVDPSAIGGGAGGGASGGAGKAYLNHQATGQTLDEAMDNLYKKPWRPVFVAHNTIVVFGEDYARHGLDEAMDYFDRHKDFRRIQMFAIAHRCCALDVFKTAPGIEKISARAIRELVDHQVEQSTSVRSLELDVANQLLAPSRSPLIASVQVDEKHNLEIGGVGLFHGGNLVGFLNPEQTQGLLWFTGQIHRTALSLPCGNSAGSGQNKMAVNVVAASVHTTPQFTQQGLVMLVKVRGMAEVAHLCPGQRPTAQTLSKWKQALNQQVAQDMQASLRVIQEDDVDAVGFGTRVFQVNPSAWRAIATRWPELFPTIRVRYDVRLNILRTGMTSDFSTDGYTPQAYPPKHGREESIT